MKKWVLFTLVLVSMFKGFGQCEPSLDFDYNGIYPSTLPPIMEGYPYEVTLSFKIPRDSVIVVNGFTVPVTIDSARMLGINGLPKGLQYGFCNRQNCTWLGGTRGCAKITGFIDTADHLVGDHPATVYIMTWFTAAGIGNQTRIDSSENQLVKVVQYNSIAELGKVQKLSMFPNPAQSVVTIQLPKFTQANQQLTVMNALGQIVYEKQLIASDGEKEFNWDCSNKPSGLYYVYLQNGNTVWSNRLMVNGH